MRTASDETIAQIAYEAIAITEYLLTDNNPDGWDDLDDVAIIMTVNLVRFIIDNPARSERDWFEYRCSLFKNAGVNCEDYDKISDIEHQKIRLFRNVVHAFME